MKQYRARLNYTLWDNEWSFYPTFSPSTYFTTIYVVNVHNSLFYWFTRNKSWLCTFSRDFWWGRKYRFLGIFYRYHSQPCNITIYNSGRNSIRRNQWFRLVLLRWRYISSCYIMRSLCTPTVRREPDGLLALLQDIWGGTNDKKMSNTTGYCTERHRWTGGRKREKSEPQAVDLVSMRCSFFLISHSKS